MAKLAIKGHPTRGNEVITLLEMLGGINERECDGANRHLWYSINELNEITFFTYTFNPNNHEFFTLEEFLERFPYKVGDKVYYYSKVCDVIEMRWNSILNTISYGVCDGKNKNLAIVEELKPYEIEVSEEFYNKYCAKCGSQRCTCSGEWLKECEYYRTEVMSKNICDSCLNLEGCLVYCDKKKQEMEKESKTYKEETMEELRIDFPEGYGYAGIENKQVIFTKIEPQYPKTYERCCNILKYSGNYYISLATKIDDRLFEAFYKLKVCRDAYWKIAGEQMGLGKSWEPDTCQVVYSIARYANEVVRHNDTYGGLFILEFPTKEMRDAFYENYKDLIEECKELL